MRAASALRESSDGRDEQPEAKAPLAVSLKPAHAAEYATSSLCLFVHCRFVAGISPSQLEAEDGAPWTVRMLDDARLAIDYAPGFDPRGNGTFQPRIVNPEDTVYEGVVTVVNFLLCRRSRPHRSRRPGWLCHDRLGHR